MFLLWYDTPRNMYNIHGPIYDISELHFPCYYVALRARKSLRSAVFLSRISLGLFPNDICACGPAISIASTIYRLLKREALLSVTVVLCMFGNFL